MSEQQNTLSTIIAKALLDEAFKQQLIADPAAMFKAEGVVIPEGITVQVVADTESVRHLVLLAVGGGRLSDSELEAVAGAGGLDGLNIATELLKQLIPISN